MTFGCRYDFFNFRAVQVPAELLWAFPHPHCSMFLRERWPLRNFHIYSLWRSAQHTSPILLIFKMPEHLQNPIFKSQEKRKFAHALFAIALPLRLTPVCQVSKPFRAPVSASSAVTVASIPVPRIAILQVVSVVLVESPPPARSCL